MNKIGIITLNGYYNYGNRLQNYATQEVVSSLGFQVETIVLDIKNNNNVDKKIIEKLKEASVKRICKKVINKVNKHIYKNVSSNRKDVFIKFTKDYIKETDYKISKDNIPSDLSKRYEYFISGSDQVWNPYNQHGTSLYFLTFAEKDKRISYAASFAISEIPSNLVENYKVWLSEMCKISVREYDGANIVKGLTGREVPVHVDPTLLLTKDKWLTISKAANNKPKTAYLLTYFLGGIPQNYKKQIKKIATENNLKIINLGDIREKETYKTGPSEFIDYINSCSVFCTDSFHGAVFSILLEKPFIVYERISAVASMFSRIDTLLSKFNLESRKVENIKSNEDIFNINFSGVKPILESERNKALEYLKDALNIQEDK